MAETVLGNVMTFFTTLGVFDILLPFILVFTVLFAILERTKIFGTEKGADSKEFTKKNLNAMVSFVMAFLVIASSKLVAIITKVSSEIVVLFFLIIFFLALVGSFYSATELEQKKGPWLDDPWKTGFMVFVAISISLIFLDAITTEDGETWLNVFWNWLSSFTTDTAVASILLIILLIIIMYVVIKEPADKPAKPAGG